MSESTPTRTAEPVDVMVILADQQEQISELAAAVEAQQEQIEQLSAQLRDLLNTRRPG